MTKSTPSKPRIPLPVNPEVEVVWSGSHVSPWGEKGSLLPPTHNVGSAWQPCVEKLKRQLDGINKRQTSGG
jgi:hypothetical protein